MSSPAETLLALLGIQVISAMSPGPNNIQVLQNAMRSRKLGICTALGILPASVMWASAGLFGLGSLLAAEPKLTSLMYIFCGGYLLWLGAKSIWHSFSKQHAFTHIAAVKASKKSPEWQAFLSGILTNATNPKTVAYFMSVFAATNAASMPLPYQIFAVLLMPVVGFSWFSTLTFLVSNLYVRRFLDNKRHLLDRLAGTVMIGFGIKLLTFLI